VLTLQLDIQVGPSEGAKYLEKYELKANDAILAEEKHMPIYDDIVANAKVDYVAGGAAQNAARAAAVGSCLHNERRPKLSFSTSSPPALSHTSDLSETMT
jgi:hypothetical protein